MGKRCVLAEEKMLRNDCFSEELMFDLMYFSAFLLWSARFL
jgi:hypothetical protein